MWDWPGNAKYCNWNDKHLTKCFAWEDVLALSLGSLSMQRFWTTDGNRKCAVFVFYFSSHYHINVVESLFTSRYDQFENLRETTVLACEMSTSGWRPWLKNVACLSSLLQARDIWATTDDNRGSAVFLFNMSSHYHIYIKYLFTRKYNIHFRNVHFRCPSVTQKRRLLKLPIFCLATVQ